jgi:hypothetical protein
MAALQLPRRTRRLRRARLLPHMLRPRRISPPRALRRRHMSPRRALLRPTRRPPRTSQRHATRPHRISPHRVSRRRTPPTLHASRHRVRHRVLRHVSPRRVPRRRGLLARATRARKEPRRGTRSKRLAQRRARRGVPQPAQAVLSPRHLPRVKAAMPGLDNGGHSQTQLRDNQTQLRARG